MREQCVSMYPLLPTIQRANAALIKQAMDELVAFYRKDEITLSQLLVWMQLLLARTDTISPEAKDKIQEHLSMYDALWEDNPKVKKTLAQGRAEGKVEGEITTLQRTLVHIVSLRFPALTELVQERVKQLNNPEELDQLVEQAVMAPDEATARKMLLGPPAV